MITGQLETISDLWGVGWFADQSGEPAPYPATMSEMSKRQTFAENLLAGYGVVADDVIVFVARSRDAVQFASWESAANELGAAFCVVDGYRTDAHRLAAYLELFSPRAVLGLVDDVVLGLLGSDRDPVSLLAEVPVVAARPKARRRLAELGLPTLLWQHLGPAMALECRRGNGAHLEAVWNPEIEDGTVVLHPSAELALGTEPIRTGWPGALWTQPCECGTPGPRVVLDPQPGTGIDDHPGD